MLNLQNSNSIVLVTATASENNLKERSNARNTILYVIMIVQHQTGAH